MTKPLTRAEATRIVDEIDAQRIAAVLAIFERPEVQQAKADLEALIDPSDNYSVHAMAGKDMNVNALISNALVPFNNVPDLAARQAAEIDLRLNPPAPVEIAQPDPTPPAS